MTKTWSEEVAISGNDFRSPLEEIRPLALYNLKEDLSETTNLLGSHPEQTETLLDEFKTYLTEREFKSGPRPKRKT